MREGVTLLFTDIQGSTRLWETEPRAMSLALRAHDALCREAVRDHAGVVVKMTGDGLYAAFDRPADAAGAAVQLLRALADPARTAGLAIRSRCALHLGEVERRDGDLFGPAVNRVARIMSAAHGGQVLLSAALVAAMARPPRGCGVKDLGRVRLKDLATAEHVYQLTHPDLQHEFPALRSLESVPNNLPRLLTRFVGRQRELQELSALLDEARLVTVLATGGVGKTRLTLQAAATLLDAFDDGVWFIDLAPLREEQLVEPTIARVLGLQLEADRPARDTLGRHLIDKHALLLLDNCEHLAGAAAAVAEALLAACPRLAIVATSREVLRVPGERVYALSTLQVPPRTGADDSLLANDAVTLLLDRVRLQVPGAAWSPAEIAAAASICRQLDGIPLALELAAARARSLSLPEIDLRLHDRFRLLDQGARNAPGRQQTLRALVAWSYDLLSAAEQSLLEMTSVFAGGFTLDSLLAIAGEPAGGAGDAAGVLLSLVDKSLVLAANDGDGKRYRLLDTIREFARVRLQARGDAVGVRRRHADHFFAWAKQARDGVMGTENALWMRRFEIEHDNIRAAMRFLLGDGGDPVTAVKIEVAIQGLRLARGYAGEGISNLQKALAQETIRNMPLGSAHAMYVCAALHLSMADYDAASVLLEQCLALRRQIGDDRETGGALSTLSVVRRHRGEMDQALELEREALTLFRSQSHRFGEAVSLLHLGEYLHIKGDVVGATQHLACCLQICRDIAFAEIESDALLALADVALTGGDTAAARGHAAASLEVASAGGLRTNEARSNWYLGRVALRDRDAAMARKHLAEALAELVALEAREAAIECLLEACVLTALDADDHAAARLAGAARQLRAAIGLRTDGGRGAQMENALLAVRERMGAPAFDAAVREGRAWSLQAAAQCARDAFRSDAGHSCGA